MTYKIKTEVEVPEKSLGDVLVTAFDGDFGGSNFWSHFVRLEVENPEAEIVDRIWTAVVIQEQGDEEEQLPDEDPLPELRVDYEVLVRGMQLLLDRGHCVKEIHELLFDDYAGSIDANIADSIVQMGLFNQEVYG